MKIKVFQGIIPAADHCQHETHTKRTKNKNTNMMRTWTSKPRRVTEDHLLATTTMTTTLDEDDAESKNDDGEEVYETYNSRRSCFNIIEEERISLVRGTMMTTKPCLYVYDQQNEIRGGSYTSSRRRRKTGILVDCSLDDYDQNKIRKHENTIKAKEDDCTSLLADSYHPTTPVCLTFRDNPKIQALIDATLANTLSALLVFDFIADDGMSQTRLWQVVDENITSSMVREFARVPVAYIADGHHRIASASRIRMERALNNPQHNGTEDYNFFLGVLFPASHMDILPYNRMVKTLNTQSEEELITRIGAKFKITPAGSPTPTSPGNVHMYLAGKWYCISWDYYHSSSTTSCTKRKLNDTATLLLQGVCLDVVILQDEILEPLLNIDDPRTNECLVFVDGSRGTVELEARVNSGETAVAFSMYPITMDQMMDFVDTNQIMPPKSTWFEPKICSELVVQRCIMETGAARRDFFSMGISSTTNRRTTTTTPIMMR